MTKSMKIAATIAILVVIAIGALVMLSGQNTENQAQLDNSFFSETKNAVPETKTKTAEEPRLETTEPNSTNDNQPKTADPGATIDADLADIDADFKALENNNLEMDATIKDASEL